MKFPSNIYNAINLSEKLENVIVTTFLREELPKGHLLFREGEICRRIFFIEKGICRAFNTFHQNKNVTVWFSAENNFMAAVDSFSLNTPSQVSCELLEPSTIYSLDYAQLDTMLKEDPEMARIAFYILMEILKQIMKFTNSIKFQSAKDRFDSLMNDYPTIFLRVPLGHIASYLGMTQETLSRMRAKK